MSPLLYRLSYRAAFDPECLKALFPTPRGVRSRSMVTFASFLGQSPSSVGTTIALLLTFLGIGVIVNVLIIYIVAQVAGERKENQERSEGGG